MRFKLVEKLLCEGTWCVPFTQKQVNELEDILSKPINNKDAKNRLYNIYGNDELFDKLFIDNNDVRPLIKSAIKDLINHYENNKYGFNKECPEDVLNKLKMLVK